ncbi:hypothetical protein [Mesorhizobium loti]|nr:hypothetical protein [Mesorhizobium loti]
MAPRLHGQPLASYSTERLWARATRVGRGRRFQSKGKSMSIRSMMIGAAALVAVGTFAVHAQAEGFENIVLSASKDAKETQATFAPDTANIFLSADLTDAVASGSKLTVSWISLDSGGVAPANYKIDEVSFEIGMIENHVDSSVSKPDAGWPVGTYQVQIAVDGTVKEAVDFSVK